MPWLSKRQNGYYYFCAEIDGRQQRVSLRTKTGKIARERYAEMADRHDRGILSLAPRLPVPTLQDLFDAYLPYCKTHLAPRTHRDAEMHIRMTLGPAIGHIPAPDLTPAHIEALTGRMLERGYHPRTINLRLETLRKILRRAVEHRRTSGLAEMPCTIRMLRVPDSLPRYAYPEQIREWMAHMDTRTRVRSILSLMTGITDRDLGYIRVSGYDRENALLRFRRPKTTTDIVVPLTPIAVRIMDALIADTPGPLLFQTASARSTMYRASRRSGRNITPHMLRHSFATWLVSIGVPLSHIKEVLGHKSIKTTERYAKVIPEHLRESMGRIEAKEFDVAALLSLPKREDCRKAHWTPARREAQADRMRGNKLGFRNGKYAGEKGERFRRYKERKKRAAAASAQ